MSKKIFFRAIRVTPWDVTLKYQVLTLDKIKTIKLTSQALLHKDKEVHLFYSSIYGHRSHL